MKKVLAISGLAATLLLALSLTAFGAETWKGWISDSMCGAKGATASHKDCAVGCIKKGGKYVLVTSSDKMVHPIHNQDAVTDANVGMEVTVTGSVEDDKSIHVDSIKAAM